MNELKPCPFCGEKPLMVHSALNEYHSVASKIGCSRCRYIIQIPDLAIDMDKSVKENCDFEDSQTISYWNTRPAEDALTAEVKRLSELNSEMEKVLRRQCALCQLRDHEVRCEWCDIEKILNKIKKEEKENEPQNH